MVIFPNVELIQRLFNYSLDNENFNKKNNLIKNNFYLSFLLNKMTEYSNSLVRPNNAYNTLSTYNVSAPGTVHGPLPLAGTPSMNVQTVLNPPPLKYPVYNALSYDSNGSGYYTISTGQYGGTCSVNGPRPCKQMTGQLGQYGSRTAGGLRATPHRENAILALTVVVIIL